MESRRAKGLNLAPLVKLLKGWRRRTGADAIPGIPEAHAHLVGGERILSSSWYPMDGFLAVLEAVHTLVLGGTDEGIVILGRGGAEAAYGQGHAAYLKATPAETMRIFERTWRANFDFGTVETELGADEAIHTFRGYRDIGASHGKIHLGWFPRMLEMAGAERAEAELLNAPWETPGGDDLRVRVFWA